MRRRRRCGISAVASSSASRRASSVAVVAVVLSLALSAVVMPSLAQTPAPPPTPTPPPPPPGPRLNRTVTVRDAGAFRAALDDGSVSEILVSDDDMDIEGAEAFPKDGPPAIIHSGRTLFIRSADRAAPSSLNFSGGQTPAIVVSRDAALVFSQILLTSAKPPATAEAGKPPVGIAENYAAPELGMWPSVSLEPGSEVRRSFVFRFWREKRRERERERWRERESWRERRRRKEAIEQKIERRSSRRRRRRRYFNLSTSSPFSELRKKKPTN